MEDRLAARIETRQPFIRKEKTNSANKCEVTIGVLPKTQAQQPIASELSKRRSEVVPDYGLTIRGC